MVVRSSMEAVPDAIARPYSADVSRTEIDALEGLVENHSHYPCSSMEEPWLFLKFSIAS